MRRHKRPSGPGASVLDDWLTELPQERERLFKNYTKEFETVYLVLSISLDEAVDLHKTGRSRDCYEAVGIIPTTCVLLTNLIDETLCNIEQHCMRGRISPSLAPLNPEDFLGSWSRRSASMQSIQDNVLSRGGLRFRYKLRKLRSINRRITDDFCQIAGTLSSEGVLADVPELWTRMAAIHFDINTCMRETIVMLKCFLQAIPENTFREFEQRLAGRRTKSSPVAPSNITIENRNYIFEGLLERLQLFQICENLLKTTLGWRREFYEQQLGETANAIKKTIEAWPANPP